jgi:hypothetical protein
MATVSLFLVAIIIVIWHRTTDNKVAYVQRPYVLYDNLVTHRYSCVLNTHVIHKRPLLPSPFCHNKFCLLLTTISFIYTKAVE